MSEERQHRLAQFVDWSSQHITGDEKGQAQIFLDRLFQAFGQRGSLDVGGTPEFRVRSTRDETGGGGGGGGGGGTSFADYVWKPVVLIEMKKRGELLAKHRQQAFDYWIKLVPNRPQYTVLCNFDEFWIYDFNIDLDDPLDTVTLATLPQHYEPLNFLFPTDEKPIFQNNRVEVTKIAADRLASAFFHMTHIRKIDRQLAQRFILQMLVALFAEDIDLLPKSFVTTLLADIKTPEDSYDLLGNLFEAMNRPHGTPAGRFKGVRYFNGGLFKDPARLALDDHGIELAHLRHAAQENWSKVSPDIFGTLFQHSMDAGERHAFGAHYTAPIDIMKIVKPTIVEPWTQLIDNAKKPKQLADLLERISLYTVLDPACGSGNFLYIAYRELKRLESKIRDRLRTEFPDFQATLHHVTARQFHGMDIIPFAIELAKVTMMIARKLAIDELHIADEPPLPLDNLDKNFQCTDALLTPSPGIAIPGSMPPQTKPAPSQGLPRRDPSDLQPAPPSGLPLRGVPNSKITNTQITNLKSFTTPWPLTDIIIGNPPFLGAKRLKPERGPDYVNTLRKLYPDVPGMADYCVYWFRRAHDHLPLCTPDRPEAGRAGLVGTQNIRNNQSRVGGLDHIVKGGGGVIIEAVDNQPWSGEANVHVSIANWVKTQVPPVPSPAHSVMPPPSSAVPGAAPSQRDASSSLASSQRDAASTSEISNFKSAPHSPTPPSPGIAIPGSTLPTANAHASSSEIPNPKSDPLTPASPPSTASVSAGPTPALAQKLLIPEKKKLWFKSDPKLPTPKTSRTQSVSTPGKSGKTLASKSYELDFRETPHISAALSDATDVTDARTLSSNTDPKMVFQGITPGHAGFVLGPREASKIIERDRNSSSVIHPYLIGRELVTGDGKPERFVIDFGQSSIIDAQRAKEAFKHVQQNVLPDISARAVEEEELAKKQPTTDNSRRNHLQKWWLHWRDRADFKESLRKLKGRFIACSRLTKRPIFVFVDLEIRPADALQAFIFDDDYSFGILQSSAHWLWFITKCAKMKSDFTYTANSVFDTFPWPQSPNKAQINAVAAAGREIRRIRTAALQKIPGGLRALYRTLELPGQNPLKDAHASLDSATLAAYGFNAKDDLLSQLLTLNLSVAARIEQNHPVTGPGVPEYYGDPTTLITDDCITP